MPSPVFNIPYADLDDEANIETTVNPIVDFMDALLAAAAWLPIGVKLTGCWTTLPSIPGQVWAWADGSLIAKATYPGFFAAAGNAYNGGVDPGGGMVRLPDQRGRVSVGWDQFGASGPRLTGSDVTGAVGGQQALTLSGRQSGIQAHAPAVSVVNAQTGASIGPRLGNLLGDDGNASGVSYEFTYPNSSAGGHLINRQSQYSFSDPGHGHSATSSVSVAAALDPVSVVQPFQVDKVIVRVA
jgi:microcystin-dependent protein